MKHNQCDKKEQELWAGRSFVEMITIPEASKPENKIEKIVNQGMLPALYCVFKNESENLSKTFLWD